MKIIQINISWTKFKGLFFVFLCAIMNLSCQKFVNIKKNSSTALLETANDCQLLLDNYSGMNVGYPSDGEASSDNYYLSDVAYLTPSFTQGDRDLYTWEVLAIRPGSSPHWQSPYKTTYYANLVIETVEKLKSETTNITTLNTLRGSALFFRAFCFWQVAQLYTKPYNAATADQDPGIPLRLTSDINDKSVRGTIAQTYSRILQDITEAVDLLQPTSSVATRPNKAAAYALLARVYLSMRDYPNALINANAALQINSQLINYNTLNSSSSLPFNPRFNKEVIFHSLMAADATLNPNNNIARINPALYASYKDNDLRKVIFFKQNNTSVNVRNSLDLSKDKITDSTSFSVPDGTYKFTGNYEPSTAANFFNGLAVDELYLIRAECYARAGNTTAAMMDLNTLLITRWVSGTYVNMTAASADDALSIILTERRKELLMRGLRWTDARRLNIGLTRQTLKINGISTGTVATGYTINFTYPVVATYNLPSGDPRFTLLIPQEVIENSAIPQNSR